MNPEKRAAIEAELDTIAHLLDDSAPTAARALPADAAAIRELLEKLSSIGQRITGAASRALALLHADDARKA